MIRRRRRRCRATHWSCRSMADRWHLGTTHSFVNRVWRSRSSMIRTFKLDRDVVGLYLDCAGQRGGVQLSKKSQIQALEPTLPMKKGHDGPRPTTLFAALEVASGKVIGRTYRKHRHQEVLPARGRQGGARGSGDPHRARPTRPTSTQGAELDRAEEAHLPALHATSASWANLVERFFATLTGKQIRRGVFTSVPHLEKCLRECRWCGRNRSARSW